MLSAVIIIAICSLSFINANAMASDHHDLLALQKCFLGLFHLHPCVAATVDQHERNSGHVVGTFQC